MLTNISLLPIPASKYWMHHRIWEIPPPRWARVIIRKYAIPPHFIPTFQQTLLMLLHKCTVPHSESARVGFFLQSPIRQHPSPGVVLKLSPRRIGCTRVLSTPSLDQAWNSVREKKKGLTIFCLVTFLAAYRKSTMAQLLQYCNRRYRYPKRSACLGAGSHDRITVHHCQRLFWKACGRMKSSSAALFFRRGWATGTAPALVWPNEPCTRLSSAVTRV